MFFQDAGAGFDLDAIMALQAEMEATKLDGDKPTGPAARLPISRPALGA